MGLKRHLVAVTAQLPGGAVEKLKERFRVRLFRQKETLTEERLAEAIGEAEGAITLLSDPVTEKVLENSSLKMIAQYAVGYNNIDIGCATRLGILVSNTPEVLTDATADLTMALILAVARRVAEGDRLTRRGGFKGWSPGLLLGMDLKGKNLGVIGMGRIGMAVARRAVPFGMKVFYTQRKRLVQSEEEALNAAFLPLEELLGVSDVVSVHCPLTKDTAGLLDRERLFSMKKGAILVNTGRGPVVDEEGLCEALDGHLMGAGLDVYEKEPVVHPGLLKRRNVVLLPHIGSAGRETREEMADMAAANLVAYFSGNVPPNVVPEQRELAGKLFS